MCDCCFGDLFMINASHRHSTLLSTLVKSRIRNNKNCKLHVLLYFLFFSSAILYFCGWPSPSVTTSHLHISRFCRSGVRAWCKTDADIAPVLQNWAVFLVYGQNQLNNRIIESGLETDLNLTSAHFSRIQHNTLSQAVRGMIFAKTHFGRHRNYMTLQLSVQLPDKPSTVIVVTTKINLSTLKGGNLVSLFAADYV